MEHSSNQFEKMTGSLEDRFDFLNEVAGTMTASAYRAVDVTSNQEVTVWRTRGPLQSSEVGRFQDRLLALQRMPRVETILWCGVDSYNRGFAVLRAYDGRKVDCAATSKQEIEERFDGCAAILEALHDRGITCGDVCLDSFLLKDRGGITLFAVLGDVALQNEDDDFNRNRYLAFRPPEQKNGGVQPTLVDVYALARLGEGLCAVKVKEGEAGSTTPPPWLQKLLDATATEEGRKEHGSVHMTRLPRDGHGGDETDAVARDEMADLGKVAAEGVGGLSGLDPKGLSLEDPEVPEGGGAGIAPGGGGFDGGSRPGLSPADLLSPTRVLAVGAEFFALFRNPSRVLILALLNLVAMAVLFYSYVEGKAGESARRERVVLEVAKRGDDTTKLAALYVSQSPTAFQELIQALSATADPAQRKEIVTVLVFRARRDGLGRTADVILGQLDETKNMATFGVDDQSRPFVRVLDPALPSNARLEEIARLYEVSPRLATILAAASALDTGDAEAYRGLFAKAAAEQSGVANAAEHNPLALMLLLPDVHDLFSEDIVASQEKIPPLDVVWLLDELGRQGRPEVSTIAQIAERRDIVTGPQAVFLRELRRSAALKHRIRVSMVSGALGKVSLDDVRRFNEWYGQGASRVLEASILSTSSPEVKQLAFDSLSAKPTEDPYVMKLMEFIRSAYGNESSRFAGVVAAIDLRDTVGAEVLTREFAVLQDAPRGQEFLRQLVRGAPPVVIEMVLRRYGDSMEQLDIVDLLSHPSPAVRTSAVSSLTKVNDIMLLKLISQSYDDETDSSVRAAYEEKISIIKERAS